MSAVKLLADLAERGIQLDVRGDRLGYKPKSQVTPELLQRLKAHKAELLELVQLEATAIYKCCWCGSDRLNEGASGSIWCDECKKQVWGPITDGMVRANEGSIEVIDPPDPCPKCGTLELWQSVAGNWKCQHCDPPTKARELRERAAKLRKRHSRVAPRRTSATPRKS